MDSKALIGFLAGGALVGGLFLITGRSSDPPATPETKAAIESTPIPEETVAVEPAPEPVQRRARSKPSVKAKPAAKPSPVVVASRSTGSSPVSAAPPPPAAPRPVDPEPIRDPEAGRADTQPVATREPEPPAPPRVPNTVTVAAGTILNVRISDHISTENTAPGDTFSATLDQPLVINGLVIAERGSRAKGKIADADQGGRVKGRALLKLELTEFETSDHQKIRVSTDTFSKEADSNVKNDAKKVGIGAGIGAVIGAIAGGGRGAAIGAAAGGAAGGGVVAATRGKAADLPAETRVSFRISAPVTITEKLD